MPDGKPKTIAVDLTGKFLSADRHVRIVTNVCVYWDEIFLSESSAAPIVQTDPRSRPLARMCSSAASRQSDRPATQAAGAVLLYAISTTVSYWNPTPGKYTRYGDVRELLSEVDDRFVVMGSGDEIQLRLDSRALPPLPPAGHATISSRSTDGPRIATPILRSHKPWSRCPFTRCRPIPIRQPSIIRRIASISFICSSTTRARHCG